MPKYEIRGSRDSITNTVTCYDIRWFKYDRDKLWLVYTQSFPVIFEPPCIYVLIFSRYLMPPFFKVEEFFSLKMEAAGLSETLIPIDHTSTIRCHVQENKKFWRSNYLYNSRSRTKVLLDITTWRETKTSDRSMQSRNIDAMPLRYAAETAGRATWEEPVGRIEYEDYLVEWKHNKEVYKDTRIKNSWRNERWEIFTWPRAA